MGEEWVNESINELMKEYEMYEERYQALNAWVRNEWMNQSMNKWKNVECMKKDTKH